MTYREWIIAQNLCRFPPKSFYRFGDRNTINKIVRANYMNSKGIPIDVQAMDMTESYGYDIEPADIVDFVNEYLRNPWTRKIKPDYDTI